MNFSYDEYRNIIKLIQQFLPIMDFADITPKTEEFCVIRHDIEFSIDRAAKLAEIENQLGINTTYTVQLRNNTYNALSEKNIELIHYIKSLGHCIALHQNPPYMSEKDLKEYVLKDIETLEHYYGFEVDRYAFHRPKQEQLAMYLDIPGKINCYGELYFHYFEGEKPDLNVTYLADSNHKWKYGHPITTDFNAASKLQLNTHPFSWTERGYENYGNFLSLIEERKKEMLFDMESENKAFPKELLL
jgi:hypothetical protein|tara:strand:+ start:94 stop:828 length:735 start_codon:yes stop_codon:yes gene_type:complete